MASGIYLIKLSVNINKVATIRNSRGGVAPSVLEAARVCVETGAPGITVHPRADARHITAADVRELSAYIGTRGGRTELNIEGDPRPELLALVHEVGPTQCTLVPVRPGEVTSQAGWPADTPREGLREIVNALRAAGIRVSVFVEPDRRAVEWAADIHADRVELYTEPFARAFERNDGDRSFDSYAAAATHAHTLGLGINAGHDLDLDNLVTFRRLPYLDEVSIGHALISRALFVGLARSVREYLDVLAAR